MSPLIKKTLVVTLLLLIAFSVYVALVNPEKYVAADQWQQNTVKAQHFLYGETQKKVIVGSSMSARLTADKLPGFYNLAFSGQGNIDGLRLILAKEKLPDSVFIEINSLLVLPNIQFYNSLTNPVLYSLRKYVKAFREGKQPLVSAADAISKGAPSTKGRKRAINRDLDLFETLLAAQVQKFSITPPPNTIQAAISELQKYVRALKAGNVGIVFFELPKNPKLCDLPLSNAIRNAFYQAFPRNKYTYIPSPDCAGYRTTDGIHLGQAEIARYAAYFRKETSRLGRFSSK